jgi:hypothetical protein
MVVEAPPRPPEHHEDPEALIEEARRRTRRRRLVYAAAAALALAVAGILFAIVELMGGTSATGLPPGFHAVRARGQVQHLRVEWRTRPSSEQTVQLSNGQASPTTLSHEVWYDEGTHLYRVVGRLDSRVLFDLVGKASCYPISGGKRFCIPPGPLAEFKGAPRWPLNPKQARETGTGTFRGRSVIWVESLANGRPVTVNGLERWGLDARTHEALVRREVAKVPRGGRFQQDEAFTRLKDLPAKSVTFAVPDAVPSDHAFPPHFQPASESRTSSLGAAGKTLGTAPLWLGRSFRGQRLLRVETGTEGMRAKAGKVLERAPFVSFDYGIVKLREFGAKRSFTQLQGPPSGRMFLSYSDASVTRGDLLVLVRGGDRSVRLDRALALALAKALQPLPGA